MTVPQSLRKFSFTSAQSRTKSLTVLLQYSKFWGDGSHSNATDEQRHVWVDWISSTECRCRISVLTADVRYLLFVHKELCFLYLITAWTKNSTNPQISRVTVKARISFDQAQGTGIGTRRLVCSYNQPVIITSVPVRSPNFLPQQENKHGKSCIMAQGKISYSHYGFVSRLQITHRLPGTYDSNSMEVETLLIDSLNQSRSAIWSRGSCHQTL